MIRQKASCQRCSFEYKYNDLRKEWTGLYVCEYCYDPRHPQDYVKAVPDDMRVPYTRPENTTVSVEADMNETTQTDIPSGTFSSNTL
jgi:hypothetical protein